VPVATSRIPLGGAFVCDAELEPEAGPQPAGVCEQVTTPIAWVDVPALGVSRVDQTYRRLPDVEGLHAWEYRDLQHGPFVLTVDADGLVVTYEDFARRVATRP